MYCCVVSMIKFSCLVAPFHHLTNPKPICPFLSPQLPISHKTTIKHNQNHNHAQHLTPPPPTSTHTPPIPHPFMPKPPQATPPRPAPLLPPPNNRSPHHPHPPPPPKGALNPQPQPATRYSTNFTKKPKHCVPGRRGGVDLGYGVWREGWIWGG